jgi:hypothetical protein
MTNKSDPFLLGHQDLDYLKSYMPPLSSTPREGYVSQSLTGDAMFCQILSIMTPKKQNKAKASSYFEDFFIVGVD